MARRITSDGERKVMQSVSKKWVDKAKAEGLKLDAWIATEQQAYRDLVTKYDAVCKELDGRF